MIFVWASIWGKFGHPRFVGERFLSICCTWARAPICRQVFMHSSISLSLNMKMSYTNKNKKQFLSIFLPMSFLIDSLCRMQQIRRYAGWLAVWLDFGEILPFWHKFTSHCYFFDSLFIIWQNADPTLANLWLFRLFFFVANCQILKNNLTIWSH